MRLNIGRLLALKDLRLGDKVDKVLGSEKGKELEGIGKFGRILHFRRWCAPSPL